MTMSTVVDMVDGRFVIPSGYIDDRDTTDINVGSNVGSAVLVEGLGEMTLTGSLTLAAGFRVTGACAGARTVLGARMGDRGGLGRRGEVLGVCVSIGALTGLLERRTGADDGAIPAIAGRGTVVDVVGIGFSIDIFGTIGDRRFGLRVTVVAVGGDRTGSGD